MLEKLVEPIDRRAHDRSLPNSGELESRATMVFPADAYWAHALISTLPPQSRFVLPKRLDDAAFALRTHGIKTVFVDPHLSDGDLNLLRGVARNRGLACTFVVIEDPLQRERVVWLLHQRLADRAINLPFRPRVLQALVAFTPIAADRPVGRSNVLLLTADSELADNVNERLADISVTECTHCSALGVHLRNGDVGAVLIDIEVDQTLLAQAIATVRNVSSTVRLIGLRRSADTVRDAYLLGREGFNRILTMPSPAETLRAACFGRRYDTQAFLHSVR